MPTIVFGTPDDDLLYSGKGYKVYGLGGNDTLIGFGGAMYGGDGDDTLTGWPDFANDKFYGGAGNDVMDGNYGDDLLYGGDGDDRMTNINGGNDKFYGEAGNDLISLSTAYELETRVYVEGGTGNDEIYASLLTSIRALGGDGDDILQALAESVYLDGGAGNDQIRGQATLPDETFSTNYATLIGGAGDDLIQAGGNAKIDAGDGNDSVWLYSDFGRQFITLGKGADTVAPFYLQTDEVIIKDFDPNLDKVDLGVVVFTALENYVFPNNPFETGHLRVVQAGGNALIQADPDGPGGTAQFETAVMLEHVKANTLNLLNMIVPGFEPL